MRHHWPDFWDFQTFPTPSTHNFTMASTVGSSYPSVSNYLAKIPSLWELLQTLLTSLLLTSKSVGKEHTISMFTWLNSHLWNGQSIGTLVKQTQVWQWYCYGMKVQVMCWSYFMHSEGFTRSPLSSPFQKWLLCMPHAILMTTMTRKGSYTAKTLLGGNSHISIASETQTQFNINYMHNMNCFVVLFGWFMGLYA